MNINKKGFINISLSILFIALISITGYFILTKKLPNQKNEIQQTNNSPSQQLAPEITINNPTEITINNPTTETFPKTVNWESLLPTIRTILKQEFPDIKIELTNPITIYKKLDITNDGIPEALVSLGSGGAATNLITLMRIEDDKPMVALFKQKDGKISPLVFIIGSGGAGRYGYTVEMLNNKNSIYYGSYSKYGENTDYCQVEWYQWNSQTKIFEYNEKLSAKMEQEYCQNIGLNLN